MKKFKIIILLIFLFSEIAYCNNKTKTHFKDIYITLAINYLMNMENNLEDLSNNIQRDNNLSDQERFEYQILLNAIYNNNNKIFNIINNIDDFSE